MMHFYVIITHILYVYAALLLLAIKINVGTWTTDKSETEVICVDLMF